MRHESVKGKSMVKGFLLRSFDTADGIQFHGTAAELRSLLVAWPGAYFKGLHLGSGVEVTGSNVQRKRHNKQLPSIVRVSFVT